MAAVAMSAVHEDMHQRAKQKKDIGYGAQNMSLVFTPKQNDRHAGEHDKD